MPVKYETEQEHYHVYYDLKGTEAYRDDSIKACHQWLEGVYAEHRTLKEAYCDAADEHAEDAHEYALDHVVFFEDIL